MCIRDRSLIGFDLEINYLQNSKINFVMKSYHNGQHERLLGKIILDYSKLNEITTPEIVIGAASIFDPTIT